MPGPLLLFYFMLGPVSGEAEPFAQYDISLKTWPPVKTSEMPQPCGPSLILGSRILLYLNFELDIHTPAFAATK